MTEPQVWVLIGVFATAIFGTLTLMTASINRTLTEAIGGVHTRVGDLRDSMNVRFDGVDRRLEALDARVGKVEVKVDGLDRDVQAISRRVFGADNA